MEAALSAFVFIPKLVSYNRFFQSPLKMHVLLVEICKDLWVYGLVRKDISIYPRHFHPEII